MDKINKRSVFFIGFCVLKFFIDEVNTDVPDPNRHHNNQHYKKPVLEGNKPEPVHEISNNVVCATSKASGQPAHMHSLIRAFASRLSIL